MDQAVARRPVQSPSARVASWEWRRARGGVVRSGAGPSGTRPKATGARPSGAWSVRGGTSRGTGGSHGASGRRWGVAACSVPRRGLPGCAAKAPRARPTAGRGQACREPGPARRARPAADRRRQRRRGHGGWRAGPADGPAHGAGRGRGVGLQLPLLRAAAPTLGPAGRVQASGPGPGSRRLSSSAVLDLRCRAPGGAAGLRLDSHPCVGNDSGGPAAGAASRGGPSRSEAGAGVRAAVLALQPGPVLALPQPCAASKLLQVRITYRVGEGPEVGFRSPRRLVQARLHRLPAPRPSSSRVTLHPASGPAGLQQMPPPLPPSLAPCVLRLWTADRFPS